MQDEIFGPILPIIGYKKEEEIQRVISRYERPLGFYVFSSRRKFIDKLFADYSFGGGVANDSVIQFINDNLPFGGVGHSGMGDIMENIHLMHLHIINPSLSAAIG